MSRSASNRGPTEISAGRSQSVLSSQGDGSFASLSGKTISCQTNWSNWPVQVEKQQIIPTPPTEQEWEFVKACRNSNYGGEKHCEAMMYGPVLKAILKYINREAEYETMLNLVILNMRRKMAAKGESTDKIFDALNSRHFEQQRRELADKNRINDLERRINEDPKRKLNTIKLLEIGENVLEELKRHFEDFPPLMSRSLTPHEADVVLDA